MMHRAWCCLGEVPYCFSRSSVKFQGHTAKKNLRFWPKLGVSGLLLQFEFTNGYEMMHKAWSSIEEVPYRFSTSSVKFQGHMGQNRSLILTRIERFRHCNSSFKTLMAIKWCTKLEAAKKGSPIVFQGHLSNFKVTWEKICWFWPELRISSL